MEVRTIHIFHQKDEWMTSLNEKFCDIQYVVYIKFYFVKVY